MPKEAQVISKSGVDWHPTKRVNMTNSPFHTERMLHESLKRLKRDVIDIYMIHWPDTKFDIREPLEVLKKAQEAGKIKHIGLCNTNLEDLESAREVCDVDVIQSELNLFNSAPFDCLKDEWKEAFSMSWGTFDKGILTGRVTRERKYDKSDSRHSAPWWNKKDVLKKIERTEQLKNILPEFGLSLQDFCLHYNLYYYGLSTVLIGFKTEEDIVQMTSNLQQKLMRERIEEVLVLWNNYE
jgi:aryl-alcohol dehydrogenase-like predicted oxidoreductase